ncbi:dnaJ homolog subfamily C member 9 [Aplysia californica]|uniref:DnaJ homolog subfamily C member 9 n=1 Tax=Aplysia californica TaxID=6500 RepID=A0ABM1AEQ1_APLCA|nr:dnaJ homolog subfamily C member 9 [Aplysia californica]
MPKLLENCKTLFHTDCLYGVLGVTKDATQKELKKGYHRRSLAYHPDRAENEDKAAATEKFQVLGQVYSILSDQARRAEYDETGGVEEEVSVDEDKDWDQYWRLLFPKVTQKDVEEFTENYRGSDEEIEDLKNAYLASEGDMSVVMDTVLCCTYEDEPRFTKILKDLIKSGDLPDFDKFSKENKRSKNGRLKKAAAEAKEAEEEAKKLKLDGSQDSLFAAIAQRQASRARQADGFLSQLEAKYAGDGAKKGGGGKKKSKK